MRKLSSFAKVQDAVGTVLRGRRLQLNSAQRSREYLNVGSGRVALDGFLNLDWYWAPGIVCWDVNRGLPVRSQSMRGVFSEHVLEHLPLERGYALLQEFHRVLRPGGVARLIVPDGELYIRNYVERKLQPYETHGTDLPPMMGVNRIFYFDRSSPYGHNFMYDFETLAWQLRRVGFVDVQRAAFRQGKDTKLLADTEWRRPESLYVEATR